jgi:DNA polymerase-3 subunit epsilon
MNATTSPDTTELGDVAPAAIDRILVIDTETTGVNAKLGRIIELGMVEMVNNQITNSYQWYFNPGDIDIDAEALAVHGITPQFLKDKPFIKTALPEIMGLLHGATLGGHNAKFDTGFLEAELKRNYFPPLKDWIVGVIDTMQISKERWPGKRQSLDALLDRLAISRDHRTLHGALLDATLTAQALMKLRVEQLSMFDSPYSGATAAETNTSLDTAAADAIIVLCATAEELAEHDAYLEDMKKSTGVDALWSSMPNERSAPPALADMSLTDLELEEEALTESM